VWKVFQLCNQVRHKQFPKTHEKLSLLPLIIVALLVYMWFYTVAIHCVEVISNLKKIYFYLKYMKG